MCAAIHIMYAYSFHAHENHRLLLHQTPGGRGFRAIFGSRAQTASSPPVRAPHGFCGSCCECAMATEDCEDGPRQVCHDDPIISTICLEAYGISTICTMTPALSPYVWRPTVCTSCCSHDVIGVGLDLVATVCKLAVVMMLL